MDFVFVLGESYFLHHDLNHFATYPSTMVSTMCSCWVFFSPFWSSGNVLMLWCLFKKFKLLERNNSSFVWRREEMMSHVDEDYRLPWASPWELQGLAHIFLCNMRLGVLLCRNSQFRSLGVRLRRVKTPERDRLMDLLAKQRQGHSTVIMKRSYAPKISKFSNFTSGKVVALRPKDDKRERT